LEQSPDSNFLYQSYTFGEKNPYDFYLYLCLFNTVLYNINVNKYINISSKYEKYL